MGKGITVVYEKGVLRPLQPLEIPDNSQLEIQILEFSGEPNGELLAARRALQEAGVISQGAVVEVTEVGEEELEQAYEALGAAGPLSKQIIDDREGR